jgi:hypothetical protein
VSLRGVLDALELGALLHDLLAKLLHLVDSRGALARCSARQPTDVVQDLLSLTAADLVSRREQAYHDVVDFVCGHRGCAWGCAVVWVGGEDKSAVDCVDIDVPGMKSLWFVCLFEKQVLPRRCSTRKEPFEARAIVEEGASWSEL